MVPADATFAEIGRYRISGLGEMLRQFLPAMGELEMDELEELEELPDLFALFAEHTGVDLERELLAHFGDSYGCYLSDTTGGGGLLSAVLFMEVNEPDALRGSLQRLADKVNALAREHARGYVAVRSAQREGLSLTTLTFPGLPVPLEISWTIGEGYLVVGATPRAVIAALEHARGAGPSLLDNERFLEMGGSAWQDAIYVEFIDIPRLARHGYGLTQLGCSALANAVRSPQDPRRDPGLVLPGFDDLIEDAKATVSIYRLDGDDLVGAYQADRSMLVNLSGGLGLIAESGATVALAALGGGVILPSFGQARQQARIAKSSAQVRQLVIAMMIHAAENDDAVPPGFEALGPYIDPGMLSSPFGPVSDGRGDYWMNTTVGRLSRCRFPDRQVALYDRAMYEHADKVVVGFFDGHVEILSTWELDALAADEPNAGTDLDLPEGW
jgi:prepilin-type processing-associated H-X9-DG protein